MGKYFSFLTYTPETLRQSSPQLFHLADFFRGLGGWHQVAHFHRLAANWVFGDSGEWVPGFRLLISVLQRTGKTQETESTAKLQQDLSETCICEYLQAFVMNATTFLPIEQQSAMEELGQSCI